MWRKHRYIFQNHINYIHNDTVKPFRVGIPQYTERVREMHDLVKYIHLPSKKGDMYDEVDWTIRNI